MDVRSLSVLECLRMLYFVFFFQAEDGIRDLVRSRGLGDVYKRQVRRGQGRGAPPHVGGHPHLRQRLGGGRLGPGAEPVSYTHLTLPTSDLV